MILEKAQKIAEEVKNKLAPHCERIEIAGSIRRAKPDVGDIEIVAIPKPYEVGMFESGIAKVVNQWKKVRGELPCKYTQRILPEGIKLDLFFATPENWGYIFTIRTGSANFSGRIARRWQDLGFKGSEGMLTVAKTGEKVPIREETELFELLDIPYLEPKRRN